MNAKQVLDAFNIERNQNTISVSTVAKRYKATWHFINEGNGKIKIYTFPDNSCLAVKGRGPNHTMWLV